MSQARPPESRAPGKKDQEAQNEKHYFTRLQVHCKKSQKVWERKKKLNKHVLGPLNLLTHHPHFQRITQSLILLAKYLWNTSTYFHHSSLLLQSKLLTSRVNATVTASHGSFGFHSCLPPTLEPKLLFGSSIWSCHSGLTIFPTASRINTNL